MADVIKMTIEELKEASYPAWLLTRAMTTATALHHFEHAENDEALHAVAFWYGSLMLAESAVALRKVNPELLADLLLASTVRNIELFGDAGDVDEMVGPWQTP